MHGHSKEHLDAIRPRSISHWKRQQAAKAAEREALAKSNAGLVAAARAERDSGKPLVVESLVDKLKRLLPGTVLKDTKTFGTDDRYEVLRGRKKLATGASEREAIDRAVFLWGGR